MYNIKFVRFRFDSTVAHLMSADSDALKFFLSALTSATRNSNLLSQELVLKQVHTRTSHATCCHDVLSDGNHLFSDFSQLNAELFASLDVAVQQGLVTSLVDVALSAKSAQVRSVTMATLKDVPLEGNLIEHELLSIAAPKSPEKSARKKTRWVPTFIKVP